MKDLTEDINSGSFRHVYLLYGEENYLKFQMRDRLISAIGPEFPDMNISRFEGAKTDENDVIELCETLPFFSERRVIRLDRTGLFARSAELLPDYM
ncbi:MAG: DNA polymerase III subunit delta, partial [Lachnospiraceae bacterium]|nr:DNA polymerase III subunit delta [Lachnospiraceae bacterium]